eukprot:scaffold8790_cov187-Amphora_coffeaeformis.AAC.10
MIQGQGGLVGRPMQDVSALPILGPCHPATEQQFHNGAFDGSLPPRCFVGICLFARHVSCSLAGMTRPQIPMQGRTTVPIRHVFG